MAWCQLACPLSLFFPKAGLIASGQPLALSDLSTPPAFSWASAEQYDSSTTYDLVMTASGRNDERNASVVVWTLSDIPGAAVSKGASAANGTESVPWRLEQLASMLPGTDLIVHATLRTMQRMEKARSSFQTRTCLGALHVTYGKQAACACEAELTPTATFDEPATVQMHREMPRASDQRFVLLLVDRDALSWQQPTLSPLLHAAYADVPADRLVAGVDLRAERALLAYMGPAGLGRGSYSSPHRYSWRAYPQLSGALIPPFPATFDRTSFALAAWLASNHIAPQPAADDLFRSEAALADHTTCDGALGITFGHVAADCEASLDESVVARPPLVRFAYPYFESELQYAVCAVEPSRNELLWLVVNVRGDTINAGSTLEPAAGDASTLMTYVPPAVGGSALILLYVQPDHLPSPSTPLHSRARFDPATWAASVGIARPSASNGFAVAGGV